VSGGMRRSVKLALASVALQFLLTLSKYYGIYGMLSPDSLPPSSRVMVEIGRLVAMLLPPPPLGSYLAAMAILAIAPLLSVASELAGILAVDADPSFFRRIQLEEKPRVATPQGVAGATNAFFTRVGDIIQLSTTLSNSEWFRSLVLKALPGHPPTYYARLIERLFVIGLIIGVSGAVVALVVIPGSDVAALVVVLSVAVAVILPASPLFSLWLAAYTRKSDVEGNAPVLGLFFLMGSSAGVSFTRLFRFLEEEVKTWPSGVIKDAKHFSRLRIKSGEASALRELGLSHPSETVGKLYLDLGDEINLGGDVVGLLAMRLETLIESFKNALNRRAEVVDMLVSGVLTMYAVMPAALLSIGLMSNTMGGAPFDVMAVSQQLVFIAPLVMLLGLLMQPPDEMVLKPEAPVVAATVAAAAAAVALAATLLDSLGFPAFVYAATIALGLPVSVWLTIKERVYASVLDGASRFAFELQDSLHAGKNLYTAIKEMAAKDFGAFSKYVRNVALSAESSGLGFALKRAEEEASEPLVRRLFAMMRITFVLGSPDVAAFKHMARFYRDFREFIKKHRSSMIMPRIIGLMSTVLLLYVMSSMIGAILQLTTYKEAVSQLGLQSFNVDDLKNLIPFYVLSIGAVTGAVTQGRITGAVREVVVHAAVGLVVSLLLGLL